MARTSIDIDEELIQRVMRRYGLKTRQAAVARVRADQLGVRGDPGDFETGFTTDDL